MNKTQFIQQVIIRTCPGEAKIRRAISHAEWLWDELTKAGYGDQKTAKTKKSRGINDNSLSQLNERQKTWFNRFWTAFDLKQGKQEAAQRWLELGEQTDEDYKKIIAAATKEARRDHGGLARKYPQGWLTERRWEDYAADPAKPDQRQYQQTNSELNGLKQLYANSQDPALLVAISKLEQKLSNLRGGGNG